MFACIQNPGIAPVEGFTLLGVSTTRDCGVAGVIGQFGSGNKHAINVLLRAGLKVFVYCGRTRLEFYTRDDEINDGLIRKAVKRVMCKMGGTSSKTIDLGWVLDFGAIDWTDLGMAMREFVSNAIDRTVREEGGEFLPALKAGRLSVTIASDDKMKAKDGYTRVYVELNESVQRYVGELPRRFLHFSDDPAQVKKSFLPKANRNLNGKKTAVIYREGVYVREIEDYEEESIYDYNFKSGELQIDESRNSSDWAIRAAIAKLYRTASSVELAPLFQALTGPKPCFEDHLDPDYIISTWDKPKTEQSVAWQTAWEAVAGDAVLCDNATTIVEFVERKGYKALPVRSHQMVEAAKRFGVKTDVMVLTSNEQKGREKLPPSEAASAAVNEVWGWLEKYGLTNGKKKPGVGCFRDVMNGGSQTLGFCDDVGVYFADDHCSGRNKMLLQTVLEEVTHWCTKSCDGSRDLQDFAFRMVVEILA
ncbi:MAG: hypothetical protein ABFC88_12980 [Thermoguttaceae bacterium]